MNIFQGICEDNTTDPLKMGRIKVRVFGVHTEIKQGTQDNEILRTEDLPWAVPVFPLTSTVDGISNFAVPENGSVVLVMFLDEDKQKPVYIGSVPKIFNENPNKSVGFSDPDGVYPSSEYAGESPISRLARNEKINLTSVQFKKDQIVKGINANSATFSEPDPPYAAKYPDNKVIESASGHVIEIDDTEGAERINIFHKSGSYIELHPSGKMVERVNDGKTSIIIEDKNVYIDGDYNMRVTGSHNVYVEGSENILVDGDVNLESGGTINIDASSNVNIDGGSGGLQGVVTGSHICHFTGKPHGDKSSTVKASK
jgi:hypothetical protein